MLSRNLLLGLGVLALLAGVMLAVLWFRQSGAPAAPGVQAISTQSIMVAARAIPAGTLMRLGDMSWSERPASEVVGTNIVRGVAPETEFVGAVARRAFAAGEALTTIALVKPGDRDFLVAALGPGYRAISIAVDATQSTSGLIMPGDYVDVLLTQNFSAQGADAGHKSVGETVLRALRIIAVDQELTAVDKPATNAIGDLKMPKTITLEVTEKQAAALLVAEQLGKIDLALRGQQDQEAMPPAVHEEMPPTWASDVSQALGRPSSAASKGAHDDILVIHGSKIERLCPSNAGLLACP